MNDQMVLNRLGIEDFRHLTKQKAIELVSMLDRVDPAVAIEALRQFPELAKFMSASLDGYADTAKRALDANDKSQQEVIKSIDSLRDVLAKELEREDLSSEERERVIGHMMTLVQMASDKDSENKKFILEIAKYGLVALLGIGVTVVAVLGGNVKISDIAKNAKDAAKSFKA